MPKIEHTKREGDAVYIHPKAAWEKLRMAGKTRQNVYIYGATGYGKTELLRRYLRRRKHTWLNAGELTAQQLQELELPRGVIVVIDDRLWSMRRTCRRRSSGWSKPRTSGC